MPDIQQQYEKQHLKNIAAINRKIKRIYQAAIDQVKIVLNTITYKGTLFNLNDYPALKKKIDAIVKKMQAEIYGVSVNGIKESWNLSNKKNDTLVESRIKGSKLKKASVTVWFDSNQQSFDAFLKRTEKGLNLSDRVWNSLDSFKPMVEQTIGLGLAFGESAIETAQRLKKYLNNPGTLFRRVRGDDGKLSLSTKARNYHPGKGVYRSSYQNALRLSATETNMAYRYSDYLRWQKMDIVIGQEIKTSNNHPKYDICDFLAGVYPKNFNWKIWHPRCLCYKVSKLVTDKQFEAIEDAILAGKTVNLPNSAIKKFPKSFTDYVAKNKARISGWKSTPYWVKDNPQIKGLFA